MIFPDTKAVLDALSDVCGLKNSSIPCNHTDRNGNPCRSDCVVLEKTHNIGFEVLENEIIAFYFGEHCHFEDCAIKLEEGGCPYVQRAIAFLRRFFSSPLQLLERRKGNRLVQYEWFFLLPDGRKESIAGQCFNRLFSNPFRKPTLELTTWHYFKASGMFHCCAEHSAIVQVIQYDWNLLLEIHQRDELYTYTILQNTYDEEDGDYFWIPAGSQHVSIFDTAEKAVTAAKEEAKVIKAHHKS